MAKMSTLCPRNILCTVAAVYQWVTTDAGCKGVLTCAKDVFQEVLDDTVQQRMRNGDEVHVVVVQVGQSLQKFAGAVTAQI